MMCTMPCSIAHRMQPDAELFAIASQRFDLSARYGIGDRLVDVDRRHVVVLGGDGQVRSPNTAAGEPKPVERLRAGHLVDEVQIDVDQIGFAGVAGAAAQSDDVVVPYLLRHVRGRASVVILDYLTIWNASISL